MLRRFSASGFALAMIALIALRFPALGFCLCLDEIVLEPGSCCEPTTIAEPACGCCAKEPPLPAPDPCHDCLVILSLDPGVFTWSADQFTPGPPSATPFAVPAGFQDDALPASQSQLAAGSIRGSPPRGEIAVLLRTQVLRL